MATPTGSNNHTPSTTTPLDSIKTRLSNQTSTLSSLLLQTTPTSTSTLTTTNKKLTYQLSALQSALKSIHQSPPPTHLLDLPHLLSSYFSFSLTKAFPDLPLDLNLLPPMPVTGSSNADYQCNGALAASGPLHQPPRTIANLLLQHLPLNPIISSTTIGGPGFLNIHLNPEFLKTEVLKLVKQESFVNQKIGAGKKVIIDMSAPNVAKEMHVGHLRSTIIGDSLSRLLALQGYTVLKLNHVGDWGTQFGMLIAHLEDKFPNYVEGNFVFPVRDLQAFYKESKARFDSDPLFKSRAYAAVVALQSGDKSITKAWKMICQVSRDEFEKIYERLEIEDLIERGESFYQGRMERMVEELERGGHLTLEEQAPEDSKNSTLTGRRKLFFSEGAPLPLIIVKSDGGFTYDTSDLATLKQRVEEERADWVIYVVDAGQSTHFQSIFSAAKTAGFLDPSKTRVDHVEFGVVLGEDKKKFKTRSGDTVRLKDLLDEGLTRAKAKLLEKGREKELSEKEFEAARTAVAYGCVKYADLRCSRGNDYVFSFDKMLDDKGNTAVYLLYAFTRIRSIIRKSGISEQDLKNYVCKINSLPLSHEKEFSLVKTLLRLPEILSKCTEDLTLHPLCEFLYDVATGFSEFYDNCYVIEKDGEVRMERLVLCEGVCRVLGVGFRVLGLRGVERM